MWDPSVAPLEFDLVPGGPVRVAQQHVQAPGVALSPLDVSHVKVAETEQRRVVFEHLLDPLLAHVTTVPHPDLGQLDVFHGVLHCRPPGAYTAVQGPTEDGGGEMRAGGNRIEGRPGRRRWGRIGAGVRRGDG